MNLEEAVRSFNAWSYPWEFDDSVKNLLKDHPEELAKFDCISGETYKSDHWKNVDLSVGADIAKNALREKFPEVGEDTLAAFVRSASYSYWRG